MVVIAALLVVSYFHLLSILYPVLIVIDLYSAYPMSMDQCGENVTFLTTRLGSCTSRGDILEVVGSWVTRRRFQRSLEVYSL